MTRRELLLAGLAAGIAAGKSRGGVSHLSVISDEVGLNGKESIAFAKQYGLKWFEMRRPLDSGLYEYAERLSDSALRETARRLSDNGIGVSVLDSALLKVPLPGTVPVQEEDFYVTFLTKNGLTPESMFLHRMEYLKRSLHAAHVLGARNLRIFAFWRVREPSKVLPRIADILAGMADFAQKEGCHLLLETETSTNVATSDEAAKMMKLVPSHGLGINWDPQNSLAYEKRPFPDGYAELPKDRIGNVHVKAEGLLGPKQPMDWGAIMRAMLKDDYQDKFSLETHRGHGPANVRASHVCIEKMLRLIAAASA